MPHLTLRSGARLCYGEAGVGPPIIMVHGSPGDGRAWANVIKRLPSGRRILTPDLPGHGGSDPLPPDTPNRTEAMGSAIRELAAACGGPVWLCGHSYGANVALHAAVGDHDQVAGLLLFEPVFLRALELSTACETLQAAKAFFVTYLVRAEFAETDAIGLMIDFWCGAGTFARLPPRVKTALNAATARNAVDVRASFSEVLSRDLLNGFRRPAIVAHGTASPDTVRAIARALVELLPQASTALIPGASHLLLDTHPGDVAALIETTINIAPLPALG
jgi:pimeloyl-ACP methyl ester carboxylesterase